MRKRVLSAWALYRHGVALKGLLLSLGVWGYLLTMGATSIAVVSAMLISLPIWGKGLIGIAILAVLLFCIGFTVAIVRVGTPRTLAGKIRWN